MINNKPLNDQDNRVLNVNNPTPIMLEINGQKIKAFLNDSTASQALLKKLPVEVTLERGSSDYCGVFEELPFTADERQDGWFSGDISFDPNGNWFVLFIGGDNNRRGATEITLGQVAGQVELAKLRNLGSDINVKITLRDE